MASAPSMTEVLSNVESELANDPNVTKFAPPHVRGDTLQVRHSNFRRKLTESLEELNKLQDYVTAEKKRVEQQLRDCG